MNKTQFRPSTLGGISHNLYWRSVLGYSGLFYANNKRSTLLRNNYQCKEAFDALIAAMRDMKRRYFLTPPLADSDYIALGLKPHDTTPTASGTPTAQVTIETYLVERHELGVKIIYVTGTTTDPATKGYRLRTRGKKALGGR